MKVFQKEKKFFIFEFIGNQKTTCVNMKKIEFMELQGNEIYLYVNQTKMVFPFNNEKKAKEIFEKLKDLL